MCEKKLLHVKCKLKFNNLIVYRIRAKFGKLQKKRSFGSGSPRNSIKKGRPDLHG